NRFVRPTFRRHHRGRGNAIRKTTLMKTATWDLATGKELAFSLDGDPDEVRCLAFSPNGMRLVAGMGDMTARVWGVGGGGGRGATGVRRAANRVLQRICPAQRFWLQVG